MDTNTWVAKAKDGFNTLDVSEKYINSALKWLDVWLTDQAFSDYVPQIQYLIENGRWEFFAGFLLPGHPLLAPAAAGAWSVSDPTGLIPGRYRHPPRAILSS